jgi:hypothetical protein
MEGAVSDRNGNIKYVDCGDNSCVCCPPEERKGMRTNGGCRCVKGLVAESRLLVCRAIYYWRHRAPAAESQLADIRSEGEIDRMIEHSKR